MRIDLNVPFGEKDQAKMLGAKWDPARRVWYVREGTNLDPFKRWMPPGWTPPGHVQFSAKFDIEPEMIRRLLQLCHPDKHNNSEASIKATQWLLSKRSR
jgi:hypothetical protein